MLCHLKHTANVADSSALQKLLVNAAVKHHKPVAQQEPEAQSPSEAQLQSASPHARGHNNRPVALETPKDQYNRHLEAARSKSGTLSGSLGNKTQSPRAAVANGDAQPCIVCGTCDNCCLNRLCIHDIFDTHCLNLLLRGLRQSCELKTSINKPGQCTTNSVLLFCGFCNRLTQYSCVIACHGLYS